MTIIALILGIARDVAIIFLVGVIASGGVTIRGLR